jgi:ssRNA-specific RNase YbeY (16S rRNA maturation enzyme)
MTTIIKIAFDPKNALPLEVINSLNKILEQNLEEGKISDYSIALHIIDEEAIHTYDEELVAKSKPEPAPPAVATE